MVGWEERREGGGEGFRLTLTAVEFKILYCSRMVGMLEVSLTLNMVTRWMAILAGRNWGWVPRRRRWGIFEMLQYDGFEES